MYKIILGVVVVAVLCAIAGAIVWSVLARREEKKQVLIMVDKILGVLQQHENSYQNNQDLQPYLPIPHVRDMLIPPGQRSERQAVWDKALRFLEDNESRVRQECQEVDGEIYQVWKWLPRVEPTVKGKSLWQGEAFQNTQSGINAPMYSPSSCLKIRNMFDPDIVFGDEWVPAVRGAILEKCQHLNSIVHIHVDETSNEGCVYVKCTSPEAAGRVFKALQGNWYDGKLVSVRYLRDERYLQRCPDSAKATTPLRA
jgi:membrane protein Man1